MNLEKNRIDIRDEITNKIIISLENGVKPWKSQIILNQPHNAVTKQNYSGINRLYLSLVAYTDNYKSSKWLSYNQAKSLGGNIKKGEKGTRIIFYKMLEDEKKDDVKQIPIMKYYSIYNLDQCENIPIKDEIIEDKIFTHKEIDQFINQLNINVENKNNVIPCYAHKLDKILMPTSFKNDETYFSTLLHEVTHWSGHEKRLNRFKKPDKFGSNSYAFEELVAEIGSAFLCSNFGINEDIENHASYIDSWLKILKEDKKAIFQAAARAQEATKFLLDHTNQNLKIA